MDDKIFNYAERKPPALKAKHRGLELSMSEQLAERATHISAPGRKRSTRHGGFSGTRDRSLQRPRRRIAMG